MDEKLTSTRKNRLKILYVPNDLLLDILFAFCKHVPMCVQVPVLEMIPEDVQVIGTWYSIERDAVGFKLWHESFDEVPQGVMPPEIVLEQVLLKTIETKAVQPTIADEEVRRCEYWVCFENEAGCVMGKQKPVDTPVGKPDRERIIQKGFNGPKYKCIERYVPCSVCHGTGIGHSTVLEQGGYMHNTCPGCHGYRGNYVADESTMVLL